MTSGEGRVEWSETDDEKEWDDFVIKNGGSIFHQWSWRRVLENGDSRPYYLACRDAKGRILAVCPFFYRAGRHFLYLDSLLDSSMAGPIVSNEATNTLQLVEPLPKLMKFTPANPVVSMLLRVHQPRVIEPMMALGYEHKLVRVLFILDLQEKTPDHIWNRGFKKHDRQAIKYYERQGGGFELAGKGNSQLDYLNLQKGLTVHRDDRADFLSKARLNMGDRLKEAVVTLGDEIVAGFLMLCDAPISTVHLLIMGYSPLKNIHSTVTFFNWKMINWAFDNGFRYVDLGAYNIVASTNPEHHFYRLRERFQITAVPRYQFTILNGGLSSVIARRYYSFSDSFRGKLGQIVASSKRLT